MRATARLAIAVPALAALAWAITCAADQGMADQAVYEADVALASPAAEEGEGSKRTLDEAEARLHTALARDPALPTAHELLARISARRAERPDRFERAAAHYAKAIAARPSSPYAWAGLAEAKYRAGDTSAIFETALVRAVELGPGEPEVQRTVEDLGLATWDEIAPETRRAVELAIANGLRRDPAETLQIAGRRGRLAVACAQRDAVPQRSGETWVRLCKAREART